MGKESNVPDTDGGMMVSEDRIKRAYSALDELRTGEMTIEPQEGGTFLVKGKHTVNLQEMSCSCPDFEYRSSFCKHLMAVRLQSVWGNITVDSEDGGGAPPKPDVISPEFENIPETLRDIDQWVCWKQKLHENKDGSKRWTKVPVQVDGSGFASSTDEDTWGSFRQAVGYYNSHDDVDGIGIVISEEHDDLIGVDVDDCRDSDTGEIVDSVDEVTDLLDSMDTYAEVSPSGTGLRMFILGESDAPGSCEADLSGDAHVEKYVTGRYLTVTGVKLEGMNDDVQRDEEGVRFVDRLTTKDIGMGDFPDGDR